MRDLGFRVEGAAAVADAASPQLALSLRISNGKPGARIHGIILRCQVQIEPARRAHDEETGARLRDVFGPPPTWGRTMRALLWANVSVAVPGFVKDTLVDVPLPCSSDFALATTMYLNAVDDGEVPLTLFFSGTVFHDAPGGVAALPLPRTCEARYGLSCRLWAEAISLSHGDALPISLRRDVLARLLDYKAARGIATLERTIESLLARGAREGAE